MCTSRVLLHIQLETGTLTVYVDSEYITVASDTTHALNTSIRLIGLDWNHVALVFQDQQGETNVTAYHNGALEGSVIINLTPGPLSAIYLAGSPDDIGSGGGLIGEQSYDGLIQDAGLYSRSLTNGEISSLAGGAVSLSGASLLPQCLCPTDQVANNDMQTCGGEGGVNRYAYTHCMAQQVVINSPISIACECR